MNETEETKILVIDDEEGMREGCRRALTPSGFAVDTAGDLSTALGLIRRKHYALYLIDVMLPDGSGLDLLNLILDRDPTAICIIITAFSSIEIAVEAVRRGAYNFLSKPFTSDTLLVTVNQGLEWRRLKAIERAAENLAQAKEELERLDEVKSQLMLKVAHELRAPVAAVQSYVNIILAGYVADQEIKPTLKRVKQRLQEMLDTISDLLELARLKQPQDLTVSAGPQDMAAILEDVCELLQEQAEAKSQVLRIEIEDRPTILANADHLRQIWTNLISNAIKYTPEGGYITICLQADDDELIGTVEDTGIGIASEDMEHLFQEFFRTDQAKSSGQMGTGLGLSIVKQIVDSYQGEIEVASTLGEGSEFRFVLPLEPPREKEEPEPGPEMALSQPDALAGPKRPLTHSERLVFKEN